CLVLLKRSTQCPAKLIQIELLFRQCKSALRIEIGIAEELEQRSMQFVRSRLRGYQNRRTCACTVLGRVVIGQNLEFLDSVNRRQDRDAARGQFIIVDTIEQPIRFLCPRTANREGIRSARRDFAARASVEEAVWVGFLSCAGSQRRKLNEVASVQGKVRYLLGGDDLSEGGVRGLDGYFGGADFNRRGNRRWVEREIDFALFIN